MAHKLLVDPVIEGTSRKTKRFNLKVPNLTGKFGISVFTGKKEIFLGMAVAEVEIEQVVRRRMVKVPKAKVRVFRFD